MFKEYQCDTVNVKAVFVNSFNRYKRLLFLQETVNAISNNSFRNRKLTFTTPASFRTLHTSFCTINKLPVHVEALPFSSVCKISRRLADKADQNARAFSDAGITEVSRPHSSGLSV